MKDEASYLRKRIYHLDTEKRTKREMLKNCKEYFLSYQHETARHSMGRERRRRNSTQNCDFKFYYTLEWIFLQTSQCQMSLSDLITSKYISYADD